jgi:predicted branched-subunit amino acid permease
MHDDKPTAWSPWFVRGMKGVFTLPALILMSTMVGFCAFAVESGIGMGETVFMTAAIWALPAKVLLISSALSGATLAGAFLAVSLSSIRLMPMVAALVPEIRTRRTPLWLLLALSHFVAVTAWVYTMEKVRDIPREGRVPFFAGFGITLTSANTLLVAIMFSIVTYLPPTVVALLFFLTPIYFLTSIWASARDRVVYIAMLIGLVLGPVFYQVAPEFDILYAGLVGGTAAFLIERTWPDKSAVARAPSEDRGQA